MKRINKRVAVVSAVSFLTLAASILPTQLPFVAEAEAETKLSDSVKVEAEELDNAMIVDNLKSNVLSLSTASEMIEAQKAVMTASMEVVEVPVVAESYSSEWDTKVMANVTEEVNIRETPSEESNVVGHLRAGNVGDIVEQVEGWTKITSGNVTGYVSNQFLAFGQDAENLANQKGYKATINSDSLRVRETPSEESKILTLVDNGSYYGVEEQLDGWVRIVVSSSIAGYVKAEYVTVERNLGTAISIEEEEAIRKAQEEAAAKAAAKEAAKKAAAEAKSSSSNVTTTQRDAVSTTVDEVTLLGALVQVEAGGESYEGQLAVASVVINRVNSGSYPNSISGVIYQSGQFPGAHNGKVSRVLANGVKSSCLQAAQAAINGTNNIGNYMHFNRSSCVNKSSKSSYVVIGNQCFY